MGTAVGIPLGIALLAALAWGFWERRKRVTGPRVREAHSDDLKSSAVVQPEMDGKVVSKQSRTELLASTHAAQELQ